MRPARAVRPIQAWILVAGLVWVAVSGCGEAGGALPDPEPCSTPTPLPVTPTASGVPTTRNYSAAVAEGEERVKRPAAEFLARWPSRKFSRKTEFREDLARTADSAACAASQLRAATPPGDRFTDYDRALDSVLVAYEASMAVGREAAESRNVTKYREWLAAVDALQARLDEARQLRQGR